MHACRSIHAHCLSHHLPREPMAPWIFSLCLSSERETLQLFTGRMSFLSPNQQCQNTEGNSKHRCWPGNLRKFARRTSSVLQPLNDTYKRRDAALSLHWLFIPSTHAVGSICSLPAATSCLYLTTSVSCSLVRPSLCLARRPGSCYMTLFVIRHVRSTVFFSQSTSVHTAL